MKLNIRDYLLNYLFTKGPGLSSFVSLALVQLLGRITKVSWFEDDRHQATVDDAKKFLEGQSQGHYLLGLRILNHLVEEINQPVPHGSLTQHRKTSISFRDRVLFKVFQLALQALREAGAKGAAAAGGEQEEAMEEAILLALKCVSFDFVGTSLDESTEDLGTIQVPSAWRPVIEDPATMQLFFDVYAATSPPLSSRALECLVKLACVRRSLFMGEAERTRFLNQLINGTRGVLITRQGLEEHSNYHEFCRLLGRLKTNYQLLELVRVDNYADWVQRVAEFTVTSLNSWQWASSSVYYLLGLWSRLVSSVPYLKGDSPSLLESFVPKITEAYITSRLDSVRMCLQDPSIEDMLQNEEQLQDQFDSLPYLCRFRYEETSAYLCSLMDPVVAAFAELAGGASPGGMAVGGGGGDHAALLEGQLTWLVYIVGAIVRGKNSFSSAEAQERSDGALAARVFEVIRLLDQGLHVQRYNEPPRQRLEVAILAFFQNFRKSYIGEQAIHQSRVYGPLKERVDIADHLTVLNVIVGKVATNLRVFPRSVKVVNHTLALFQDLAQGFMSGKHLLKLKGINYILGNHTREHFLFLDDPANSRARTGFYNTLGTLIFLEDQASQRFKAFVVPLQQVAQALLQESQNPQSFLAVPVRTALIGLFRDLRGVVASTNVKRTYTLVFEWIYPEHMTLVLQTLQIYALDPGVTVPLLKFMSELVLNKNQRLTFDYSSPNGIKLFWEVSKIVCQHGERLIAMQVPAGSDVYAAKYKGAWLLFQIFHRSLAGNYVNFGVFELYGDPCLTKALDTVVRLALSIPQQDVMAYRKLAKAYFTLLEVLTLSHITFVAQRDSATFVALVSSLEAGIKSLDVRISSQCASAVDNLAAYYFKHGIMSDNPPPAATMMRQHMEGSPQLLPGILKALFEIIVFEDCSNQWSLSRPMLSLILLNEQVYNDLKMQIVSMQPPERQQRLVECFERLMEGVNRSLESKNRDKFTQNLTIFRHDTKLKKI